jgi:hypothetical protein
MVQNLDKALEDLTAALELIRDDYECLKHRSHVKYLLGDLDGEKVDAERCANMPLPEYYSKGAYHVPGLAFVKFMEYHFTYKP